MASPLPVIPTARSMLEEMLAALKLRDEKPKDDPPALPSRPTLKRRPPSTKMPVKFKVEGVEAEIAESELKEKASEELKEFNNDFSETDGSKTENHSEEGSDVYGEMHVSQSFEETPSSKDLPDPRLEEFEKLIANISAELKHKEEENTALLQQLQQFEKQWAMCQEQMKCMEDVYLQQIEALKTSLVSAQMTLAAIEAAANQHARRDSEGAESPPAQAQSKPQVFFVELTDDRNNNPVQHLTKEFEKQKQVLEDDARGLDEVKPLSKSGQSVRSSIEELRELKARYNIWKKEYEVRLRHTRKVLKNALKAECEKQHEKWWFNRRKRNNKTAPQSTKVGFCHCMKA